MHILSIFIYIFTSPTLSNEPAFLSPALNQPSPTISYASTLKTKTSHLISNARPNSTKISS